MSDEKLDKIEAKIDKIQDKIGSIDVTLAAQHESLKIHIKRTDLLEKKVENVERPLIMIRGALQLVGVLAMIAAIIEGFLKIKNG